MTVSYEPLRVPSCRLESPFSWCFFGILLGALELLLPINSDACDAPPRFNSMKVKGNPASSYKAGDKVKYECRLGFKIIVPFLPTSTVCQADNTWTPPLKEACTRKSCPQLTDPVSGHLTYVNGTLEFGSQVHFVCDEGYYLLGTKILYCELDGKNVAWSEEPPRCEKVLCQPPKKIPNGMYTNSYKDVFEYNEFVTYSCNPSNGSDQYSLVGESRLVCSGRNQWSSDPPECKVIKCEYPVIKNGKLVVGIAKKFYYKSAIRVECLAGFHLEGKGNAVCGLNGTWEPKMPECIKDAPTTVPTIPPTSSKPDACDAPPRFNSMKVKGNPASSYKAGDKVEYECRLGFKIIVPFLPTSTVCQADNTWTPPLKEACKRKSCPQLTDPVNGHLTYVNGTLEFGSQVHFVCDEGYYLLGTKILYCELDGKNVAWSEEPPRCEKVLCQPPKKIPNGMYTNSYKDVFEYNEFVTYSCNPSNGSDQYSLVGESRLVCSGRNQWSSDPPECKVIKCEYPVIKNGKLVVGIAKKFYYKSAIRVECLAGFHLEGKGNAVCGLNGTWEPKMPECIKDAPTTVPTIPPTSSKPGVTTTAKSSNQPGGSTPSDESPTKEDDLDGTLIAVIVLTVLLGVAVVGSCVYKCLHIRKRE